MEFRGRCLEVEYHENIPLFQNSHSLTSSEPLRMPPRIGTSDRTSLLLGTSTAIRSLKANKLQTQQPSPEIKQQSVPNTLTPAASDPFVGVQLALRAKVLDALILFISTFVSQFLGCFLFWEKGEGDESVLVWIWREELNSAPGRSQSAPGCRTEDYAAASAISSIRLLRVWKMNAPLRSSCVTVWKTAMGPFSSDSSYRKG